MKQQISSKTVSLVFGVLVICFAIGFYAVAWQEPTSTAPNGNVATPINVSSTGQSKAGSFAAGGLGVSNGSVLLLGSANSAPTGSAGAMYYNSSTNKFMCRDNSAWAECGGGGSSQWVTSGSDIYYNTGDVGIGTASPTYKLQVAGGDVQFERATGNVGLEMRSSGGGTSFIDFSNDGSSDYDVRLRLTGNDVLTVEGGDICTSAGKCLGTSTSGFGSWLSRSINTVYQATTSGFVVAYTNDTNPNGTPITVYTDGTSNPTTVRCLESVHVGGSQGSTSCTVPVKSGDYWKAAGVAGSLIVNWIPLN